MMSRPDSASSAAPVEATRQVERPGALRREEAARYCGVSPATWDAWRRDGMAPDPLPVLRDAAKRPRIVQWATAHLDLWLMHGRPDRAAFRRLLDAARRAAR